MVHLLKTARSKVPSRRTKSKHYFSPYIRPCRISPSRGVVVKAPAGLTPKPAPRHVFLQQWADAILWVTQALQHYVHNVNADIETNEIGKFQRTHGMVHAQLHDRVNSFRSRHAFHHAIRRF